MPRFAFGVTLTPVERALVGPGSGARTNTVRLHTCQVNLPDHTQCQVTYTRYNARSHKFDFHSPLHQRIWIDPHLDGSVGAVELKAQEISGEAFAKAQAAEVKQMQRKTLSQGLPKPDRKDPSCLSCKVADQCAGKYAACIRFATGTMTRIGELHEAPDDAAREIESGRHTHYRLTDGQAIVIGICNRGQRKWQEPRFLIERPQVSPEPVTQEPAETISPTTDRPKPSRSRRRLKTD